MKKVVLVLAILLLAVSAVTVYADETSETQTAAPKESGWQKVYDAIASWSWK